MTQDELQSRVRALLELQGAAVVDWPAVEQGCQKLSSKIERMPTEEVPDLLWHFLNDADARQKDPAYGDWQRAELWSYVDTGEMVEHAPSITISGRGCLAAIATIVAVIVMIWSTR